MADIAHRQTDKILAQMERKVKKEYRQATKEVEAKLQKYLEGFERRDAQKQQQVQNGTMTEQEYKQWRVGQIAMGDRWKEMRDNLADDYTNANKIAMSIVNGYMPDVYALNHNYGTYEAEKGAMVDTSYTLYDRQTVERLLKDNPDLLPKAKVDVPADKRWNKNKINSAITQGILQGDSLKDMAKRLESVSGMNRRAAFRNAATMTTSAQNGGRMDSYKRAEKMGIKMKKQWMATLDGHTRDSHRHIDGAIVDNDKPFELDGGELMFPGDAHGPAEEVYNCRCTMVAVVDGINPSLRPEDITRDSRLGSMSYDEWKNEHKAKQKAQQHEEPAQKQKEPEKKPKIIDLSSPYEFKDDDIHDIVDYDLSYTGYLAPQRIRSEMTEEENINELAGGDMTEGSCASLAFAWVGRKAGYDVHDFKGGDSRRIISLKTNNEAIMHTCNTFKEEYGSDQKETFAKILDEMEPEKEYVVCAGRHMAIIKRVEDNRAGLPIHGHVYRFLELQSNYSGWRQFTALTMERRFGCVKNAGKYSSSYSVEVDDLKNNEDFLHILGYINTSKESQQKGTGGHEK